MDTSDYNIPCKNNLTHTFTPRGYNLLKTLHSNNYLYSFPGSKNQYTLSHLPSIQGICTADRF